MIPSMSQQLTSLVRSTSRLRYSVAEEREQRILELYEWLQDRGLNVTVKTVALERRIKKDAAREYLNDLVLQRKLISWKVGATAWFGMTR